MKKVYILLTMFFSTAYTVTMAQDGNFDNINANWLKIRAGRDDHNGWGYSYDNTMDQRPNATGHPVYFINHHFGLTFSAHSFYGGIRFYNQAWPGATYDPATGAKMVMSLTDGNVGIGITNPDEKLLVYGGNVKIYSGSPEGARLIWRGGVNGMQEYRTRVSPEGSLDFFPTEGIASALTLTQDRNVGIGTGDTKGYKLAVAGTMIAEKIRVKTYANWPDYVFDSSYRLPSLKEVELFIVSNKHLPGVPSAEHVKENGIDVGDNQAVLLRKIEELTLYLIGHDKEYASMQTRLKVQESKIDEQQKEIDVLKVQMELLLNNKNK